MASFASTSTMAMDAMIDSLMQVSRSVDPTMMQPDFPRDVTEPPLLQPMVLTSSTLCSRCRDMLEVGSKRSSLIDDHDDFELPSLSLYRTEVVVPHHGLEGISKEASGGCHLCLVVYSSLDPEVLKAFGSKTPDRSSMPNADANAVSIDYHDSGLGFTTITTISEREARLSFRFTQKSTLADTKAKQPERMSCNSSVKSPLAATFGFPSSEPQRLPTSPRSGFPFKDDFVQSDPQNKTVVGPSQDPDLCVELSLLKPKDALKLGVQTIPREATSTGSDSSFQLAKKWIRDCTEHHLKCTAVDGAKWRPIHLLDVTIRDHNNVPGIKLVDGAVVDRRSDYVTLSHAWGPSKPVRLHKGTLPALRQGIPRSELPKSIADAVYVAEKLGYRYLWVDALCIMHDDERAVLSQISEMHKIYGNAALNIAASCAGGDTEGFIRPRSVAALQPCLLDVRGHAIDNGTYMALRPTVWRDMVDKAPLQRRAWVLQERALAKRTLHFTRSELMWECHEMCCSEVHPKGIPKSVWTSHEYGDADKRTMQREYFDKQSHHQHSGNWGHLVELYCAGRLSYRSDKLLALSGLARQYLRNNGLSQSDYIAGLWKSELSQSLLWTVEYGHRPPRYRAPSWSWASTNGLIKYPDIDHTSVQQCLTIVGIDMEHRFEDVFGICESARMKVCGYLTRGLLQRRQHYWSETSCSIQFPRARVRVNFAVANFDEELPASTSQASEVYILPIACTTNGVEGLFLVATETKGEMKRLGTFALPVEDNQTNCERFKNAMKGEIGKASYEEKVGYTDQSVWFASDYRYIITLV